MTTFPPKWKNRTNDVGPFVLVIRVSSRHGTVFLMSRMKYGSVRNLGDDEEVLGLKSEKLILNVLLIIVGYGLEPGNMGSLFIVFSFGCR